MQSDRLDLLRGLIETRQWDHAWAEFQRLQSEGPCSARLLWLGSLAAFWRRELFHARQLAEVALGARSAAEPHLILGEIRFHLGMITRELGDTYVALEQFQLFLQELPILYPELSMGEGKAYYYLALTQRQRRDLDGSVESYQRAIACCRRDGLPSLLCMCLQNLAWIHCINGSAPAARACLEEAASLLASRELRVHHTLGEAYLALVEGDLFAAADRCERIFRQSGPGDRATTEEQSQAAWIAGMVALEQGNLESASQLAEIALNFGTEAKESRLMNDAGSLRRLILTRRQAGA
jgi:tetratricopeptide (TPR) repeat protein